MFTVIKKKQEVKMIFSIRDLSFELGSLLLEGWLALAAGWALFLPLISLPVLISQHSLRRS